MFYPYKWSSNQTRSDFDLDVAKAPKKGDVNCAKPYLQSKFLPKLNLFLMGPLRYPKYQTPGWKYFRRECFQILDYVQFSIIFVIYLVVMTKIQNILKNWRIMTGEAGVIALKRNSLLSKECSTRWRNIRKLTVNSGADPQMGVV